MSYLSSDLRMDFTSSKKEFGRQVPVEHPWMPPCSSKDCVWLLILPVSRWSSTSCSLGKDGSLPESVWSRSLVTTLMEGTALNALGHTKLTSKIVCFYPVVSCRISCLPQKVGLCNSPPINSQPIWCRRGWICWFLWICPINDFFKVLHPPRSLTRFPTCLSLAYCG